MQAFIQNQHVRWMLDALIFGLITDVR